MARDESQGWGAARRTAISPSFLGLVAAPYKAPELRGSTVSPKQQDFERCPPVKPAKGSHRQRPYGQPYGGKTASPKKEGEIAFHAVLRI